MATFGQSSPELLDLCLLLLLKVRYVRVLVKRALLQGSIELLVGDGIGFTLFIDVLARLLDVLFLESDLFLVYLPNLVVVSELSQSVEFLRRDLLI